MATSLTNLQYYGTEGKVFIIFHHQQWDMGASLQPGDEGGLHGMEALHVMCKNV
jgi:hypothetical protein